MYLIIKAHYYIAGSARGKYEANSVFWLALILRNVCLFVSLQESGIRYFLSSKSTWLEKGQVPFSVSFSRREFPRFDWLQCVLCNSIAAAWWRMRLPRITQHLNRLQFILQEVLLFWVREANLRGHSPSVLPIRKLDLRNNARSHSWSQDRNGCFVLSVFFYC